MAVMPSDIRHYRSRLLLRFFCRPRILAAFIAQIDWEDLYPVLCTSKALHDDLLSDTPLRDVLLCRFVPGYASCLKHRDLHFYQEVPIRIRDLHLLLISQRTELHRFPTHALRILTALYPKYQDEKTRARLITLTQAHSRFVLLLQSLVHSSPFPILPDPPEDPARRSRVLLPELTFPAPLAFSWIDQSPQSSEGSKDAYNLPQTRHRYSVSSHGIPLGSSTGVKPSACSYVTVKNNRHPHGIHMSSFRHSSTARILKMKPRLSILSRSSGRLPPPPEEPMTLKIRSKEWRRSTSTSFLGRPMSTGTMTSGTSASRLFHSASFTQSPQVDETGILLHPKRLFAAEQRVNSSASSLSDARSSWNNAASSRSSYSSPPVSPQGTHKGSPPVAPSIHSLLHAAIRNRAPILRVFVPTQHLSQPSSPEAIAAIEACEQQLQDAGLWEHLSTGDVVCNFGYIPTAVDDEGDNSGWPKGEKEEDFIYFPKKRMMGGRSGPEQRRALKYPLGPSQGPRTPFRKTWLIFDGTYLVPFTPPSHLPLASTSPLSLPSPFYYHHILPPHENPQFIMNSLPPALHPVTFSLLCTTAKVRSPKSPAGHALINKLAWTARGRWCHPSQPQKNDSSGGGGLVGDPGLRWPEIGEGWMGEWVVEYEGTFEGRQALVDVVQGRKIGQRLWEVVREKTGGGRIWLRIIT